MPTPPQPARFLFVTCQVGAEKAVKGEVAQRWRDFRFAFSRPGFLTFKLPEQQFLAPDFNLSAVFARAYGFSLGKVSLDSPPSTADRTGFQPASEIGLQPVEGDRGKLSPDCLASAAQEAWNLLGDRPIRRIHVWQRDRAEPGDHGFEPSITPAATAGYEALRAACPHTERLAPGNHLQHQAAPGDWIADCVLVEPNQWWVGFHRARSAPSCWPGGIPYIDMPQDSASRAWLKMEEALAWSQLPATAGARFAEIGSSPGGASQSLLGRGFEVVGIDPAEMAPQVLGNPKFRHIRRRVISVPRRAFRKVRWLTADMNVAPNFTLDAIESIVTHAEVNIRGMLLTLKLPQWHLASEVPAYLARIRSWGFNLVRARQLANNRREICVAALKKPFRRA
ncbi:MAG: SAM-dependent methyltransferase [Thermoguttaceae bacterium]